MDELRKWRDEAAERLKNGGPYEPLHGPAWNPPPSYVSEEVLPAGTVINDVKIAFSSDTHEPLLVLNGKVIRVKLSNPNIIEGEVIRMELTDGKQEASTP